MTKLLMVYASMSGNTEDMANEMIDGIKELGLEIDVVEAFEADAEILSSYDGILIGTYTWGDGELPDELLDFHEEMQELDLTGKKAAVFGSFDWSYGDGGVAVDIMQKTLQKLGAEIVQENLKIELSPTPEDREVCKTFGKTFAEKMMLVKN
ncbi:MAG TPA: flavodoxin [Bacillales bacterium]|nr:flavodoxin [Bacillales bacterium]